jgi:hypothetical protein
VQRNSSDRWLISESGERNLRESEDWELLVEEMEEGWEFPLQDRFREARGADLSEMPARPIVTGFLRQGDLHVYADYRIWRRSAVVGIGQVRSMGFPPLTGHIGYAACSSVRR